MTTNPASPAAPRAASPRLWRTVALVGAATGLAVSAPLSATAQNQIAPTERLWLAQAEGGEGGEGGESGVVANADSDADFLAALAFIEGHLRSGVALYEQGQSDMAITHMKHPQDEIYADLAPELAERGAEGFDTELTALAAAVEGAAPVADAQAAFADILHEIEEAGEAASVRSQFDAIALIVRTAADEYAIGVVDGKVVELHEYQDAWGFIQTAKARVAELATSADPAVKAAADKATAALTDADTAFDGLVPGGDVPGHADILFGAAASIEFAAASIK